MLWVIGLTEDIVPAIFNSSGIVVPVRALVARGVIGVSPDLRGGCDEDIWRHACNWASRSVNLDGYVPAMMCRH